MRRPCLILVWVLVGACRGGPAVERPAAPEAQVFRFPHEAAAHAALGCEACHARAAVLSGAPARPGADDHAPCDRAACHAPAFQTRPSEICTLCHGPFTPAGETTPAPYPPRDGPRAHPARFSHAVHLDKGRLDRAVGFHVDCADCHERETGAADPRLPGHAACARCHAKDGVRPALDRCDACHEPGAPSVARGRLLIQGDLRFTHDRHAADRKGNPVSCRACHSNVSAQRLASAASVPRTSACVGCHNDGERTPAQARMSQCATCHDATMAAFARAVVPRSHLPERERPDDHTLAFRGDHAAEAERDAARCARCHTSMSGSARDNCDECHQSMRPRDHRLTWRELDHGPEVAAGADRCAVCHQADFCNACHSRRPRSHIPADLFRQDHATAGLMDTRACLTCHDPREATCQGAGCHP